ncbi:hypothetical protein C2845_PM17G06170 [Panicum miliaceum]|uniref:AAA ATPase AAA+ lid domain-containing protein n=1 Tax=Panicum miliaceum TaxID=4540 RepID=A0A3L6Q4Z5_PANMI|nr:hypothetical protein C2845_PM17G06170 [Panicum miliaceum]
MSNLSLLLKRPMDFLGADLAAPWNEAAFCALRRYTSLKENSSNTLTASLSAMSSDVLHAQIVTQKVVSLNETDEKALSVNIKKAKMKLQPSAMRKELKSIAQETHGFVGADLAAPWNEAAFCALRRYMSLKENSSNTLTASFSAMSSDDAPCTNSNTKSSES